MGEQEKEETKEELQLESKEEDEILVEKTPRTRRSSSPELRTPEEKGFLFKKKKDEEKEETKEEFQLGSKEGNGILFEKTTRTRRNSSPELNATRTRRNSLLEFRTPEENEFLFQKEKTESKEDKQREETFGFTPENGGNVFHETHTGD